MALVGAKVAAGARNGGGSLAAIGRPGAEESGGLGNSWHQRRHLWVLPRLLRRRGVFGGLRRAFFDCLGFAVPIGARGVHIMVSRGRLLRLARG